MASKLPSQPLLYVTFHRHGMRAPLGNPFQDQCASSQWTDELPSCELLDELSCKYPTVVHENNPEAFDLQNFPFGCITAKGVEHLIGIGQNLKSSFPSFHNLSTVKVYSTNFQRTQVSVQSLLHGLGIASGTPIEVRECSTCAMSFYHGKRELWRTLSTRITAMDHFTQLEQSITDKVPVLQSVCPSMGKVVSATGLVVPCTC